ncbi:MAG: hypothetical protein HQL21_06970 [Candidatus Omnitrophica bacterium]|nr:hypothetical protein [Candidatus Omnitrophota bacterium]
MRDIISIIVFGMFMLGVMIFSLNMAKAGEANGGKKFSISDWFMNLTHVQQADQASQVIIDKKKDNEGKLQDAQRALEEKMDQQRYKSEATQDRIRAMEERNRAQMERLRRR